VNSTVTNGKPKGLFDGFDMFAGAPRDELEDRITTLLSYIAAQDRVTREMAENPYPCPSPMHGPGA
jgi:hypothetical protein